MKKIIFLLVPLLLCGCSSNQHSKKSFEFTLTDFNKIPDEELENKWYPKFEKGLTKKEFIEISVKSHEALWLSPNHTYEIIKATYTFTHANYTIEHEGYKGELYFVNIIAEVRRLGSEQFRTLSIAKFDNLYWSFLYTNKSALNSDKISRKDIVFDNNIGFGYSCGTLNECVTKSSSVTLYTF